MMGARPPRMPAYNSSVTLEDRRGDPEEYNLDVLDNYTLPVDSRSIGITPCTSRNINATSLYKKSLRPNNNHTSSSIDYTSEYISRKSISRLSTLNEPNPPPPPRGDPNPGLPFVGVEPKRLFGAAAGTSAAPALTLKTPKVQLSSGTLHDGTDTCQCCACHILDKKGCQRRRLSRPTDNGYLPSDALSSTGMGDLTRPKVQIRSGRRGVLGHQPPFVKTLSIIDTLSEIGPEVAARQFQEDPKGPDNESPPPSGPPSNNGNRISSNNTSDDHDLSPRTARPPRPPFVSQDFQQYTEKIYDAVTRRADEALGLQARGLQNNPRIQRGQFVTNRRKLTNNSNANNDDCEASLGLSVRVEGDDGVPRRPRHPDHRGTERGRTPDWIKRIFEIAKKGDLESVKQSIADMEGTLVRNLSDHLGNNLLHVMAVFGHLNPMAWMLSQQEVLVDALQDENKFGLTPLVCAIKYGRLNLLQWLVENTIIKDKIRCKDGERSLLHIASKYAQEKTVAWLVEYMMSHQIPLDNKDHHGNTALHLVARTGNSRVCSILLQHGADVTLKNDLGQKAWEVCVVHNHLACAEYLCVHESGLALATDLTRREAELEAATTDNEDLRINFKEVLSVSRRLLREREEAVRELSRLHDQMVEAHDNIIMTLQVLAEENSSLRERVNSVRQPQHPREHVESVIGYVTNLHERWQNVKKTWFGSSLVNMKHRMLLVEESWKKLRHRSHRTVATAHHPLDVFRGKLCAVRAQGGEGRLGDLPCLCSSEESLASLFPFSEDEDVYEGVDDYEVLPLPSSAPAQKQTGDAIQVRQFKQHIHAETLPAKISQKRHSTEIEEEIYSETLPPPPRMKADLAQAMVNNSEFKKEENALSPKSSLSTTPKYFPQDSSGSRPYWTDPSLSASLSLLTEVSPGERLAKDEICARLKEMALTSESGSCSVLEVIEPSSEDSDGAHFEELSGNRQMAEVSISPGYERKKKILPKSSSANVRQDECDGSSGPSSREATTTSSESVEDGISPPDSISIVSDKKKHFLGNETSAGTAAAYVSNSGQRQDILNSVSQPFKRKGFLHKFIKPSKWSRQKKKPPENVSESMREISLENTTHMNNASNIRSIEQSPSSGEATEAQIVVPESNTSSSQEYNSNSSEESSIGKPAMTATSSCSTLKPTDQSFLNSSQQTDSETISITLSSRSQDIDRKSESNISHVISLSSVTSSSNPPARSESPPPVPSRRPILTAVISENTPLSQSHEEYKSNNDSSLSNVTLNESSLSNATLNGNKVTISESRSVATSEDSGIVARPASSASKSDSISRPESSSSSFPPFKGDIHYSLHKNNFSLTHDMLPPIDSGPAGRMSPAPSEVSKTESALSPPSHASDLSKSESSRQTSMGKASLASSTNSRSESCDFPLTSLLPLKKEHNVKTAAIIDISCDQQKTNSIDIPEVINSHEAVVEVTSSKKEPRAWYDLSDEESDILLPDRLNSKVVARHSSSEDEEEEMC